MNKKKQILRAYNIAVIALLVLGVIYVCSRFVHLGSAEFTDNAMVHRNLTPVNTRVQGFIKEIRFNEFQHVKKGDTLVVIDDAEYRLALAQAEAGLKGQKSGSGAVTASLGTTRRNVSVASAGISVANAGIAEAKEGMDNARRDYDRFSALLAKGAVTQQQFDNAKTRFEQAHSRWLAARARMEHAAASRNATASLTGEQSQRLGQSRAGESVAEAQIRLAELNLGYTVITAPCDGYVGRKNIHTGQLVQPGQLLVDIVDDSQVWVIANYRESQLRRIRVGAEASFECDAVPGTTYKGRVVAISAASGADMDHIPVDNATGNFVKVEQRVPVRIELVPGNKADDVKRLRSGLNVEARVSH